MLDRRSFEHPFAEWLVVKTVAKTPGDDRHDFPACGHQFQRQTEKRRVEVDRFKTDGAQ